MISMHKKIKGPFIKGQGFGNKMYISELFTVVEYFHMDGFENSREIFFVPSVYKLLVLKGRGYLFF